MIEDVRLTMDNGATWHVLPISNMLHTFDIGAGLSPFMQPYLMQLRDLEIAELRRKNEAQIASAMGVPAELLFTPMVQRLINGPLSAERMRAFVAMPSPSPRRAARLRHSRRMKRR